MKNITAIALLFILTKVYAKCWSEALGYPCCKSIISVVTEDEDGKWGVENDIWCGIPKPEDNEDDSNENIVTSTEENINQNDEDFCWSKLIAGIPCCAENYSGFNETTMDGTWGRDELGYKCGLRKYVPGYNDREAFDETRKDWEKFKGDWDNELKYEFGRLSISPGSDETMLNFGWICADSSVPYVRYGFANEHVRDYRTFRGTVEFYRKMQGKYYYSKRVIVGGLTPNSSYKYQRYIYDDWEEPVDFSTSDPNKFSFIFVGDPQIGGSVDRITALHFDRRLNIEEAIRNDAFNWNMTVTSAFETSLTKPSLLLSAGDQVDTMVYDHDVPGDFILQEYEYSAFLYPKLMGTIPVAPTVGNHEMYTNGFRYHFHVPNPFYISEVAEAWKENYSDYIPGYSYYFTFNNVLVVVLETNYGTCYDHLRVIFGAYNTYPNTDWRIAVFHQDIYGDGEYHSQEESILSLRQCLTKILSQFKFDLVINGHDHVYTASKFVKFVDDNHVYDLSLLKRGVPNKSPNGVLYITANCSTGSKLYGFITNSTYIDYVTAHDQKYKSSFGILDFEKDDQNVRLTINSYYVGGEEFDGPYIIEKPKRCWAESLGYKCCRSNVSELLKINDKWGYENGENVKCGIPERNLDFIVEGPKTTTVKTLPGSSGKTTTNSATAKITTTNTSTITSKKSTTITTTTTTKSTTATITTTTKKSTTTTTTTTTTKKSTTTTKKSTTTTTTTTTKKSTTTTKKSTTTTNKSTPTETYCWAKEKGYRCCKDPYAIVYETTEDGQWGYEYFEEVDRSEWCGITKQEEEESSECWAEELGYKCCSNPNALVEYAEDDQKWGLQNNERGELVWCGIRSK